MVDPRDPRARGAVRAWLALQRALHLSPVDAVKLLSRVPDPLAALRLVGGSAIPPLAVLDAELSRLAELGVSVLPFTSPLYPAPLRALPDAAPVLLVRGWPGVLQGRAVAVVGARAATAYGRDVAHRLGAALAEAGVVVVSGLARGIDAAAHRGALEAGGLTVAFSACGPEAVYPREHTALAEQIAAAGAVVTEMPLGTPPLPHYFPLRNRLISGLSEVVVVVEARRRSGSLATARRALDQGRELMAVPGPIDAPASAGPNRLLADGARAVSEPGDVLVALGLPKAGSPRARAEESDPTCRRLLAALRERPCSRDELAARLDLDPGDLAVALVELELAQRVETDRDGRLRVVGPR